jgi:hypothetical protein
MGTDSDNEDLFLEDMLEDRISVVKADVDTDEISYRIESLDKTIVVKSQKSRGIGFQLWEAVPPPMPPPSLPASAQSCVSTPSR